MKMIVEQGPHTAIRGATATFYALPRPNRIMAVIFFSFLLSGCGFTLNSNSGLSSSEGAGAWGGAGGETVPAPGAIQALTGCAQSEY
jgi:hypothetical protein